MNYICPICRKEIPRDLMVFLKHGEAHIVEEIKKKHPEWIESDGMCGRCLEYFKQALKG